MQYTRKDLGAYKLHFIKTTSYKTITVKIHLREKALKDNITKRSFLNSMLFLSSKDYPSKREITLKQQDLYAANITHGLRRLGNYFDTSITLKVLNDKYTEEGNFKASLSFLSAILFRPKVKDCAFYKEEFDIVY